MFVNRRSEKRTDREEICELSSLGCQARWPRGSGWHHCSSEAEKEFLHTLVTWDREQGKETVIKQCSMEYSMARISHAWATTELVMGLISSDCLCFTFTSNIHMSVDDVILLNIIVALSPTWLHKTTVVVGAVASRILAVLCLSSETRSLLFHHSLTIPDERKLSFYGNVYIVVWRSL